MKRPRKSEETALSAAIQQTLTAKGCRVIRINSGRVEAAKGGWIQGAPKGSPDLIVIRPGIPWAHQRAEYTFLEVKSKTGKLSQAQVEWQTWAKLNGVRHAVVRGVSDAITAVFG